MSVSRLAGGVLLAGGVALLSAGTVHTQAPAPGATVAAADTLPKDVYADSRNRLPLPKREDMDEEGKKIYDQLTAKTGLAVGIEQASVRLYSPKLAKALGEGAHYRKYETGLSNRLLEITVLTTARELDCQYEWTQWEEHGRDPKDPRHIEPELIDLLKYSKPVVGLGEKETAIIRFGRELFGQKRVSPETFADVLRLFGARGTVDLVWLMAGYSTAAAELTVFDQHLRAGQTPLLPPRTALPTTLPQTPRTPSPAAPAMGALPADVHADSRNRLPLPRREDMDDEGKQVFDALRVKSALAVGIEQPSVRFYSPKLAKAVGESAHYLKYETGLSNRLLEVAVLATARELDCQYEWTQWEEHGRDPKDPRHIEPELIDLIKYRKPVVGIGEQESAIINLSRETYGERKVSSATFAEALRLFGKKGTVDLVWLMSSYAAAAAEITAFDQQLRADQKPLLPGAAQLPKDVYPESRNRLPVPSRDEMDAEGKQAFDALNRRGPLRVGAEVPSPRLFDPKLAGLLGEAARYLKFGAVLPPRLLETAVLVTAREAGCQYEWTQWEEHARDAGDPRHLEPALIDTIKYDRPVVGVDEREAAVIALGRGMFGSKKVEAKTFADVQRLFGRLGTVNLIGVMTGYFACAVEMPALDQQLLEGQQPRLPPRPARTATSTPGARTPRPAPAAPSASLPADIDPVSRNRLPLPVRSEMDDAGKSVFDRVTREGPLPGVQISRVRLHSPRLAGPFDDARRYLVYESGLSARLVEIAVLATARERDSQYVWTQWETYGRDPRDPRHVEPAVIDAIKYGKPLTGIGEKEAAVVTLAREAFGRGVVSSATFADVLRLFGRRGTIDVLEVMVLYSAEAAECVALDQQLLEGQRPLLPAR